MYQGTFALHLQLVCGCRENGWPLLCDCRVQDLSRSFFLDSSITCHLANLAHSSCLACLLWLHMASCRIHSAQYTLLCLTRSTSQGVCGCCYCRVVPPAGETKDYIYPNNRAATEWYHDHALHITLENAYHGLAGMYVSSDKIKDGACGEPYNLEVRGDHGIYFLLALAFMGLHAHCCYLLLGAGAERVGRLGARKARQGAVSHSVDCHACALLPLEMLSLTTSD